MATATLTAPNTAVGTMRIADITVDHRYRHNLGPTRELQRSIREHGLLHPIPVTADGALIVGGRRLAACKNLGWTDIPVTVARDTEHAVALIAEHQNHEGAKPMAASELVALGLIIEGYEAEQAAARRADGAAGRFTGTRRQSRDVASEAVGLSTHYYVQIRAITLAAQGWQVTPGGYLRTPVDPAWAMHSRITLALIDRVWAGEHIDHTGPSGRRTALTVGTIYDQWRAERAERDNPQAQNADYVKPEPARPAPRKHLAAAVATLSGLCHGLAGIGAIDPAVTAEEAASMQRDLIRSSQTINALRRKIKEYANGIA